MSEATDKDYARLKFKCRRGLKELDVMLEAYLASCYFALGSQEHALLDQLLERTDNDLMNVLLSSDYDPSLKDNVHYQNILQCIRASLMR